MKKFKFPLLTLALVTISANMNAQDTNIATHNITIGVPNVALLDIESGGANNNINMSFTVPLEAGLPITPAADNNTLWLNYSSIKKTTTYSRIVSVKLGAVVPGVDVKVTAAAHTGGGAGTFGLPSAQLTLNATTDQSIISGIGSAWTGDGNTNGHQLTYNVSYGGAGTGPGTTNYADLVVSSTTAVVTYTLSDI